MQTQTHLDLLRYVRVRGPASLCCITQVLQTNYQTTGFMNNLLVAITIL